MLESLMGVVERTRARKLLPGPRDPAMRKARVCYDHLAGDLAVRACDATISRVGSARRMLDYRFDKQWAKRVDSTRIVSFTNKTEHSFVEALSA
jgi:hypothetical protein